eukprot:s111_g33.t1
MTLGWRKNAIRYGQKPVLELYGKIQQQSEAAAAAAARAAQLAAQHAQNSSVGFPKARGSSSASAAEFHPPKASAVAVGSEKLQHNLQLPVEPKVPKDPKAKPKASAKVARISEEPASVVEPSPVNSTESTAGNSNESAGTAAMTDASKRRIDAVDRAYEDDEFSIVSETEDSPPWYPNYPGGLPSTFKWGSDWDKPEIMVDLTAVDQAIPKPAWVQSSEHWGKTIITMPKYKQQRMTFLEFTRKVFSRDEEAARYAKKLIGKYRRHITACPRTQAPDLAAWCLHTRVDAFLDAGKTYRRECAE